jgi:glycosyltransferase involved in cell wall biosynthesis
MTLDVILPTFNRSDLLEKALLSIARAHLPSGLDVRVVVIDNRSTDGTSALLQRLMPKFPVPLTYVFESKPGKVHALNAGIAITSADLVGLIDDDEEIDEGWFDCIASAFADPNIDFVGGRCVPRWSAAPPGWFGSGYRGVIGWVDPGPRELDMDASYPGILMGGNAVIRREVLMRAGSYSAALNRTGTRLLGCEDEDMYHRLLATGARGKYVPQLVIHHHVPADRLTKRYFRRWCYWRGVSLGVMAREKRAPVPYVAGVPRYLIGRAVRGLLALARVSRHARHDLAAQFESELACWDVAGFFWGRHFYPAPRPDQPGSRPAS